MMCWLTYQAIDFGLQHVDHSKAPDKGLVNGADEVESTHDDDKISPANGNNKVLPNSANDAIRVNPHCNPMSDDEASIANDSPSATSEEQALSDKDDNDDRDSKFIADGDHNTFEE